MLPNWRGHGGEPRRFIEDFLGDGGAAAPLVLFAIEVESGYLRPIRTDVKLEAQVKSVLIPCGIARAGGTAQDRTSLAELLQGIE